MSLRVFRAPKVPEVFLLFWVVKLLTTGLGEAGPDFRGRWSIPLAALLRVSASCWPCAWCGQRCTTRSEATRI